MDREVWSLRWSDDLSVGIPEIDREHQHFIEQVDDFNQAIIDRKELEEVRERLRTMLEDTFQHFSHEEDLFRQWNYPDAEHHAREHEIISWELNIIAKSLDGNTTLYEWIEAGIQIKEVLINHLLQEDMMYKEYHLSDVR